jgi:hypothetical protein
MYTNMISKWINKKKDAVKMRLDGKSIRDVECTLSIPRSTLSGWFKNVKISDKDKNLLNKKWVNALKKARKYSVLEKHKAKTERIKKASDEANQTLDRLEINNSHILDLALSMLYLGEGFKRDSELGIGNSDPLILKFFLIAILKNYKLDLSKIRAELHLRADQDPETMKKFWTKILGLNMSNFRHVYLDKRTAGTKTYESYKGVCVLKFGNVAIQRKLMYLSRKFCEKVISTSL